MTKKTKIASAIEDFDIFQALNDISLNEHEELKAFREKIIEYCNDEKATFCIFRVLKEIELELNDYLTGVVRINVDSEVILKVLRIVKIELDIITVKMKNQRLMELSEHKTPNAQNIPKPAGRWTDDKLNLIELIYAIYKTKSVNNGNVTLKEIQECFEFIFQVKLGNISNRINEIDNKKGQDKLYLSILTENLNKFLKEINPKIQGS